MTQYYGHQGPAYAISTETQVLKLRIAELEQQLKYERGRLKSACNAILGLTADPRQTEIAEDILCELNEEQK